MANCTVFPNTSDQWTLIGDPFPRFDYVLCLLIIIGVVGNSLVIFIKIRQGGSRSGGGLTETNRLVIGLATADLLTAVFLIPVPELVNVPHNAAGEFYCRILESRFLAWICFIASVYTLTTISVERFLAVVYPYYYRIWIKKHHVKYSFLVIWLSSTVINIPTIAFHSIDGCGRCNSTIPSTRSRRINGVFIFLIEYLGPLFIMAYTSVRVLIVLRRSVIKDVNEGDKSLKRQSTQLDMLRRRFTRMFIFIFAAFMVLWTPDQLAFLLYNCGVLDDEFTGTKAYRIFVNLAFLNAATANPIIYSLCLPSFRQAVKDLLLCRGMEGSPDPLTDLSFSADRRPTTSTGLTATSNYRG
ncbi:galanin receptor 2a-like [Lytechinus variegatus]|uniref:galanin receptor 2a-like n=1 Tax=Lytechinus variegatus TaxID=7654 RepID=UPI001BB0EEB9|nr:galanin receptor 2a-like [Lytechinus variegatus]